MKTLLTALCLTLLVATSGVAVAGPWSAPVMDVAKGDINGN